jgi:hypothetical protein
MHSLRGIRTRDPSNQAAGDLRFRPRGHWHWLLLVYRSKYSFQDPIANTHTGPNLTPHIKR